MPKYIPFGHTIKINNTIKTMEKVICTYLCWHLINTDPHTPIVVQHDYWHLAFNSRLLKYFLFYI